MIKEQPKSLSALMKQLSQKYSVVTNDSDRSYQTQK